MDTSAAPPGGGASPSLRRIAVHQPIYIGQQHHRVSPGSLPDTGSETVIVAKADFLCCNAVIFVDHRHNTRLQQAGQR